MFDRWPSAVPAADRGTQREATDGEPRRRLHPEHLAGGQGDRREPLGRGRRREEAGEKCWHSRRACRSRSQPSWKAPGRSCWSSSQASGRRPRRVFRLAQVEQLVHPPDRRDRAAGDRAVGPEIPSPSPPEAGPRALSIARVRLLQWPGARACPGEFARCRRRARGGRSRDRHAGASRQASRAPATRVRITPRAAIPGRLLDGRRPCDPGPRSARPGRRPATRRPRPGCRTTARRTG